MEENLKNIEKFLKLNLEVKDLLLKSAPNEEDNYNLDSIAKYADKLYFNLLELKDMFFICCDLLQISYIKENLDKLFKKYQKDLLDCGYNFDKLKSFYQTNFSEMNLELRDKVKEVFVGYTMFNSVSSVFEDINSMNDLLHVFHTYLLNNENIYQKMPIIARVRNNIGEDITLYGKNDNELAQQLFKNFPLQLDAGTTDIVAFNNKIIMMIRDLGHALTIEIDIEKDKCMIKYFIPKICNPLKASNLKGINKIKEGARAANGMFQCDIEDLSYELYEFLGNVPTDSDMLTYGGWSYEYFKDKQIVR